MAFNAPTMSRLFCLFVGAVTCQVVITQELMAAHVIWREGTRGPLNKPTFLNITWTSASPDNLTKAGQKQQTKLANYLLSRYNNVLINAPHRVKMCFVNTTYSLNSLEANLAILLRNNFMNSSVEKVSKILQPLNVNEIAEQQKLWSTQCYKFSDSPPPNDSANTSLERSKRLQYLQKQVGIDLTNFNDLFMAYDGIASAEAQGILPENLESTHDLICAHFESTVREYFPKLKVTRHYAGSLLTDMLDDMRQKVTNNTDEIPSLVIYSADQLTMASLLSLLCNDMQQFLAPQFSDCILFELYNVSGDYQVQLWYKRHSQRHPTLLTLSGCHANCSLDHWDAIVNNIKKTVWERQCSKAKALVEMEGKMLIVVFSALTAGMLASVVTYYCARDVLKCMTQKPPEDW